ncbi:hypothetical protein BH10ACI2_BH10ACI2_00250 [soil metagenome]
MKLSWITMLSFSLASLSGCTPPRPVAYFRSETTNTPVAVNTINSATDTALTVSQKQPFTELKAQAKILLALRDEELHDADYTKYSGLATKFWDFPKDSKDSKEASDLSFKLLDLVRKINTEQATLGEKPAKSNVDGSIVEVKDYLRANLNDYSSAEFVAWSPVTFVRIKGQPFWTVKVKLRAKNAFAAYLLRNTSYFIQRSTVVRAEGLK